MKHKKLTLVGAGPGSPDLITLRGAEVLKTADAIFYDALVHPDLLNLAKPEAIKIFVGKRAGQHSMSQSEINQLIAETAVMYNHVVRLKGGDPFIFGRGYEEIDFAQKLGFETAVVPGISSSTGLSALQQIPLTHRSINDGFWVITGNTSEQKLSKDLHLAAQTNATIIILMGFKKIQQISSFYRQIGKSKMPIAIIQNGSLDNEKIVIADMDNIEEAVRQQQLGMPATIIIGEVVKLHPYLRKDWKNFNKIQANMSKLQETKWISKLDWTIKSGLPEPPGILPIEHLAKLRFRRALKNFFKQED